MLRRDLLEEVCVWGGRGEGGGGGLLEGMRGGD